MVWEMKHADGQKYYLPIKHLLYKLSAKNE
jgi:hypothetical protein